MSPFRSSDDGGPQTRPLGPPRRPGEPPVRPKHGGRSADQPSTTVSNGAPAAEDPKWLTHWEYTKHQKHMSASATILNSVVPAVYGTRKVYGKIALLAVRDSEPDYIYVVWVICRGGIEEYVTSGGTYPSTFAINDAEVNDLDWIAEFSWRLGRDAEGTANTVPTWLNGKTFGDSSDGWVETLPGLAWAAAKIRWRQNNELTGVPGSLDLSVTVKGRRCYDCRPSSPYYQTKIWTANPALIAYDIETAPDIPWKGNAAGTSGVPEAQWEEWANWCNEVVDSASRFQYNGILDYRSPVDAQNEVLGHCHARLVPYNGKSYIVGDKLPVHVSGTWSAAGSATLTGVDGDALNELAVDDWVYVGTYLRQVAAIGGANSVTVSSAVTVTDERIRPIRNIHLDQSTWVTVPRGRDVELGTVPELVRIHFMNSDTWKEDTHDAHDPDVTPSSGDFKATEISFNGCVKAGQAERHGQYERRIRQFQPYYWRGVFRGAAVDLFPGDICRGTFGDGTDGTPVRVMSRVDRVDDTVELELREYDPVVLGDDYAADDTAVLIDPGYAYPTPDAPTAATQIFGERGDWDDFSLIPDKDDLTTSQGWTTSGATWDSVSYVSGPPDYTLLRMALTATESYLWYDISSDISADDLVLVTGLVKTSTTNGKLEVWCGGTGGGYAVATIIPVGFSTSTWKRFFALLTVPDDATDPRVGFCGYGDVSTKAEFHVKNVRVVDWDALPESFTLFERWTWTEHANAENSVVAYQMVSVMGGVQVVASVAVGSTTLEHTYLRGGVSVAFTSSSSTSTVSAGFYDYRMRAKGHRSTYAAFPTPTQSFSTRATVGPSIQSAFDIDPTGLATGDALVWNATTGKFEMKPAALLDDGGANEIPDNIVLANNKTLYSVLSGGGGYVKIARVNAETPNKLDLGDELVSAWLRFDDWLKFSDSSGRVVQILAGDVVVELDHGIGAWDGSSTVRALIKHESTGDKVQAGDSNVPFELLGTQIGAIAGLANTVVFQGKDSSGNLRNLAWIDGSNVIQLGDARNDVQISANLLRLSGALALGYGGYPTNYTSVETDGDVKQYGTPIFYNETRVESPELRGKMWRTSLEKSLSSGVASNLFQWDSTTGRSASFFIVYEVVVAYTGLSSGLVMESGVVTARMVNYGGTVTVAATRNLNGQTDSGSGATLTVAFGTGNGSNYGRVNVTATLSGRTWSTGEIRYSVVNTDTDNLALSLFG